MNLVDELQRIAAALEAAEIPYAVCGGIAVTIHGAVRTTKDIDLLIRRTDLDRVLETVRPPGYKFVALPMTFEKGTARAAPPARDEGGGDRPPDHCPDVG